MKTLKIASLSLSILFLFSTTAFTGSNTATTIDTGSANIGASKGPGLDVEFSPNVVLGYYANATNYAIDSHNDQTKEDGIIYGMASNATGYYQASKSVVDFAAPTSATSDAFGSDWENMSDNDSDDG